MSNNNKIKNELFFPLFFLNFFFISSLIQMTFGIIIQLNIICLVRIDFYCIGNMLDNIEKGVFHKKVRNYCIQILS